MKVKFVFYSCQCEDTSLAFTFGWHSMRRWKKGLLAVSWAQQKHDPRGNKTRRAVNLAFLPPRMCKGLQLAFSSGQYFLGSLWFNPDSHNSKSYDSTGKFCILFIRGPTWQVFILFWSFAPPLCSEIWSPLEGVELSFWTWSQRKTSFKWKSAQVCHCWPNRMIVVL